MLVRRAVLRFGCDGMTEFAPCGLCHPEVSAAITSSLAAHAPELRSFSLRHSSQGGTTGGKKTITVRMIASSAATKARMIQALRVMSNSSGRDDGQLLPRTIAHPLHSAFAFAMFALCSGSVLAK
jgi:hypothetical protein